MIVVINNNTTAKDLEEFEKAFSKLSSPERIKEAVLDYKYPIPSADSDPMKFPLSISTDDGITFCILNVTAGYGGEGPTGTCKILRMCGFKFDEREILKDSNGARVFKVFNK